MPNDGGRTDLQHPTRIANPGAIHRHLHDFLCHARTICFIAVVQLKAVVADSATRTRLATARRPMTVHGTVALRTGHFDTRHQSLPLQFTWPEFTIYSTA